MDRVINERGNVSEDIRRKVLTAARELGLKRILPSTHHGIVRINVILARTERPLIMRLAMEFRKLAQNLASFVTIHRTILKDESAAAIAEAMKRPGFDAVIVDAPDDPLIRQVIDELREMGHPVITIISDVPGSARLAHSGIDHYKAGRSAGFFLARMTPPSNTVGKVVVLCHHIGFQCHAERIRGLSDYIDEEAPHLSIADIARGNDDPVLSEEKLREAFKRHPETVGVYNAGAGNRGVVAAMKADILPKRPIFVGHELTSYTHTFMREGLMTLAIDQSPEMQAQYAIDVLMNHFNFEGATHASPPYNYTVPFVLYSPQNLPEKKPD